MSHTDGKLTEALYQKRIAAMGKRAFNFRFADAADAYGKNKRLVLTDRQPSDFLTTAFGRTFYAECKETKNPRGFNTGIISQHQRNVAVQVAAAGGTYLFIVNNLNTNELHVVPAASMFEHRGRIDWEDMRQWLWPEDGECEWFPK